MGFPKLIRWHVYIESGPWMKRWSLTIRANQLYVFSDCGETSLTSTPPLTSVSVGSENFASLCIFAEDSLQPTILQYTPVFVVANYAAWCPQRMIENAKWLSKKHMDHWTVNLRGRQKWQQLSFQSVPTLYCRDWPVFHIQLVRQWVQEINILQSNSTPEQIDTNQIHSLVITVIPQLLPFMYNWFSNVPNK